jgi:hypothetical protein
MGVCIFGQGDCSTAINNAATEFNNNLTTNISTQLVNFANSINAATQNSQSVSISNITATGCSVNLSGITQTMVTSFNFKQIAQSMSQADFSNMMTNAATAAVQSTSSISSGFLAGTGSQNVTNTTNVTNNNVNQLTSNFTYNNFQTLMNSVNNSQTVVLNGITVTCPASNPTFNISNISQNITMDMVASQISSNITSQLVTLLQQNTSYLTASNSTTVTNTGFFQDLFNGLSSLVGSSQYAIIAIVIVIIVIIFAMIYMLSSSGSTTGSFEKFVSSTLPRFAKS